MLHNWYSSKTVANLLRKKQLEKQVLKATTLSLPPTLEYTFIKIIFGDRPTNRLQNILKTFRLGLFKKIKIP